MSKIDSLSNLLLTAPDLLLDALRFIRLSPRPQCALAAESLVIPKQVALYLERQVKHRRVKLAAKLTLGIPERTVDGTVKPLSGYRIPSDHRVRAEPIWEFDTTNIDLRRVAA